MNQKAKQLRAERVAIAIGATCRINMGQRIFVALIDLTTAGCCLFSRDAPFAAGQKVMLHPECLAPLKGEIQWNKGSLAGMRFNSELYPPAFEHLARTHPRTVSLSGGLASDDRTDMPAAVRCELNRVIERAKAKSRERDSPMDVLATRPPVIGTRPGVAPRMTDEKLTRLFLS